MSAKHLFYILGGALAAYLIYQFYKAVAATGQAIASPATLKTPTLPAQPAVT